MKSIVSALMSIFFLCATASTVSAQTLHVVLAADSDSNLKDSVLADIENLKRTLTDGLPVGHVRFLELIGPNVNAATITNTLRTIQIVPQSDSVLFYYSGHGGFDAQRGHYLALTHGPNLLRSDVEAAITNPVRPKFWGIITDCCASGEEDLGAPAAAGPPPSKTLLTKLFLNTRGRIDITSSRPEQVSVGYEFGGIFTYSLCNVFGSNSHQELTWKDVFWKTRSETSQYFEGLVANANPNDLYQHRGILQRTQTPYSFKSMYGVNVNGYRLGISHQNLTLTKVFQNSAAARAGLQLGNYVVAVNGHQVLDDDHLKTAVNFSPNVATVTLSVNGNTFNQNIPLAY